MSEISPSGFLKKRDGSTLEIVDKVARDKSHEHTNKTVLDSITNDKISSWDAKSNFSGSYNDLTDKPNDFTDAYKNRLDTLTDNYILSLLPKYNGGVE